MTRKKIVRCRKVDCCSATESVKNRPSIESVEMPLSDDQKLQKSSAKWGFSFVFVEGLRAQRVWRVANRRGDLGPVPEHGIIMEGMGGNKAHKGRNRRRKWCSK